LCGFLASQRHAFESFEAADSLLDAGACLVEDPGKEGGPVLLVVLVRYDRGDAACAGRGPVGLAGIALVTDASTRIDIGSDAEQDWEMRCVRLLAAGQVESNQRAGCV